MKKGLSSLIISICFSTIVLGCASKGPKSAVTEDNGEEYDLRLRAVEGKKERYVIFSKSLTNFGENGKKVREKNEEVDFAMEIDTREVDDVRGYITLVQKTVRKKGEGDLNAMGFPELGQSIEYRMDSKAQVLKAGDYPEDSLFYVPPIALPFESIGVKDTWQMQHDWLSLNSKIPLRLDLVSILKAVKPCLGNDKCLDIEVSGNVSVLNLKEGEARFESEVQGRIIFALYRGTMLWSKVVSDEKLITKDSEMTSKSCVLSRLEEPKNERWNGDSSTKCDPNKAVF